MKETTGKIDTAHKSDEEVRGCGFNGAEDITMDSIGEIDLDCPGYIPADDLGNSIAEGYR